MTGGDHIASTGTFNNHKRVRDASFAAIRLRNCGPENCSEVY